MRSCHVNRVKYRRSSLGIIIATLLLVLIFTIYIVVTYYESDVSSSELDELDYEAVKFGKLIMTLYCIGYPIQNLRLRDVDMVMYVGNTSINITLEINNRQSYYISIDLNKLTCFNLSNS